VVAFGRNDRGTNPSSALEEHPSVHELQTLFRKNKQQDRAAGVNMTALNLMTQRQETETSEARAEQAVQPAPAVARKTGGPSDGAKILRFYKSERMLHWAIAIPFLVCFTTALVMVLHYNPDPHRPYRLLFAWTHRISGICLTVLPMLVVYKHRGDVWIHFYNIKQAWTWVIDDFKWLCLLMLSGVSSKVKLPEQGKFNAAEKLNFMVLMGTYPLYIATGLLIWLTDCAFLSWLLHSFMAVIAAPLILGHMYMAMIKRGGRAGLQGMITGFVDRQWAKHHYAHWYREVHEKADEQSPD
jgi:formate dehydrogenase subunit gamma